MYSLKEFTFDYFKCSVRSCLVKIHGSERIRNNTNINAVNFQATAWTPGRSLNLTPVRELKELPGKRIQ